MNQNKRVEYIMAYEQGELEESKILELFSNLLKTGLAWNLQGSYGRTAKVFINSGYLDSKGKILREVVE